MRRPLNHLQAYLAQEFVDEYHEGRMSRRDLFRRILGITGGVASAAAVLITLGCGPAPSPAAAPVPTAQPTAATQATTAPAAAATATTAALSAAATPTAVPTPPAKPAGTPGATPATAPTPSGPRSPLSVAPDDPAITAADITFPGDNATLMGYLARPKAGAPSPAVMVCHENRGLTDHIRDVARRFAKAGYAALAVDLLSRDGGTTQVDPAQVPGKLTANPGQNVADFQAAFRHLNGQPFVQKGKIGMVGFCFGGGVTWLVATATPDLKAAVPFYGPNPPLEDIARTQAAVLAIYGELDQRINAGIPAVEAAMKQGNKTFEKVIYPGANHAFFNDTGANYNEKAAPEAWERALAWFKKYLA